MIIPRQLIKLIIFMDAIYKDESYKIIGACMEVHRQLGCGFLEPAYQEALEIEFQIQGIPFAREVPLNITYKDRTLKQAYFADFICYGKIILELKAVDKLITKHEAQVINYLEATKLKLGLLVNFGQTSLQQERIVRNFNN